MEFIYETHGNITFLVYEMSGNENLEPMTMGMIYIGRYVGTLQILREELSCKGTDGMLENGIWLLKI